MMHVSRKRRVEKHLVTLSTRLALQHTGLHTLLHTKGGKVARPHWLVTPNPPHLVVARKRWLDETISTAWV